MLSPQKDKRHCLRHNYELNLLCVPVAKICTVCGETRPLRHKELSWPAGQNVQRVKASWRTHLHLQQMNTRAFRATVYGGLIALGAAVAWNALTPFSLGTNTLASKGNSEPFPSRNSSSGDALSHETVKEPVQIARQGVMAPSEARERIPENRDSGNRSPRESVEAEAEESGDRNIQQAAQSALDYNPTRQSERTAFGSTEEARSAAQADAGLASIAQQVSKAISARAISGVKVTYAKSTVYLAGIVKTQTQRLAAEQAARNVPGVREVRSSIRVQWTSDKG